MVFPAGFITHAQITDAVDKAIQDLGPEVVRVRYNVGPDIHDESAIHLRVMLTGWAASEETGAVADKIWTKITDLLRPYENWGLFPYLCSRANFERSPERGWN